MIKIVILSFCLISASTFAATLDLAQDEEGNVSVKVVDNSEIVQANNNNGPISDIIENVPEQTSNVVENSEQTAADNNNGPDSNMVENLPENPSNIADDTEVAVADNSNGSVSDNDGSIPNLVESVTEQNTNIVAYTESPPSDNNNGPDTDVLENLSEHTSNLLRISQLAPADDANNNGPVSHLMENLSEHTSSVTSDLLSQLSIKMQRTTNTLAGNIEVVVTSALQQLSQPIEDFQIKVNSSQCQPLVTFDELQKRIESDLSKCTQNLSDLLAAFQNDASDFEGLLEKNIKNIIALPKQCEGVDSGNGFGSHVNCYVEKISEINKQIASILNTASMTLVHTRQLAEQAVQEGRGCAENVVATTVQSLDQMLAACQIIEN